jgi:succinate dehydrogenase / fumarate reductase, membrane anchor subunit
MLSEAKHLVNPKSTRLSYERTRPFAALRVTKRLLRQPLYALRSVGGLVTPSAAVTQGAWAWVLQRITAVLLLVLLGTHLAVLHFVPANLSINFLGVAARMQSVLYLLIDGGLLAVGLYHALNGVRNVLFDYVVGVRPRRAINTVMWILGIAFAFWGAYALTAFVK